MDRKYVAALDVGTTTIRCHVFDQSMTTIGAANDKVTLVYPKVGYVEIDPEELWRSAVGVIQRAIRSAGITAAQLEAMGLCTQRASFITWDRSSGRPFHNFITWKDMRADDIVRQWNRCFTLKTMQWLSRLLYTITGSQRYLAASVIKLMNSQVTPRLLWALENVAALRQAAARGEACFGTVDTWLLHKLTGGALHVTDVSNASATGLYDPFVMQWSILGSTVFGVPISLMPEVWDTDADFGFVEESVFGAPIRIRCSIADQAAAMFGSCCHSPGDVKITMGTGTFLDLHTGLKPHASVDGLYPLVGWRIGGRLAYIVEGAAHDTGTVITWAQDVGLLKNPSESSDLAFSVKDSGGVFFIPAFSGLQAPVNDGRAASGILGVTPSTRRAHMVRAMLESIVFRVRQLMQSLQREAGFQCTYLRVDGGVARNDFVAQLLADMSGIKVERTIMETGAIGAGFIAGLSVDMWSSWEELCKLREVDCVFEPREGEADNCSVTASRWEEALQRFLHWYPSH